MTTVTNFLDEIVARQQQRIALAKTTTPLGDLIDRALKVRQQAQPFALSAAIRSCRDRFAIIAEFKRASPSKGNIRLEADAAATAVKFEENGACAVSVLTEEDYFRGSLEDLKAVKNAVSIPVLRKDFIVDEYQVYESAVAGADALLLIVAALSSRQLASLRRLTEDDLHMSALVEVHDVDEMSRAVASGATLIGVNNRDLQTLDVSLTASENCASLAPADAVLISESGLREKSDLERLRAAGFQGFLIGEALMTAADPGRALRALLA